jgi:hypothetical protein
MLKFVRQISRTRDYQSLALLLLIVSAAVWLIVLPFSRTVQSVYLQRFHLATPDFASWAIQQPVPSMYNFENRYWVSAELLTTNQLEVLAQDKSSGAKLTNEISPNVKITNESMKSGATDAALPVTKMANHFPARIFTFADSRYHYLEDKGACFLYMRSRYRGSELISRFGVEPNVEASEASGAGSPAGEMAKGQDVRHQHGFKLSRLEDPVE